ncbi:hypothetical protein BM221_005617 [Beauveria bassiana]|uniref:Putative gamma-glutamylcyclotransferase n=1 Tax=Beauveria bassiana TaxID=176275 RepID=A0A2N6NP28_BEABA|nr:hypothetical protein BM221_005617 [Beauveria bassiana]
MDLLSACESLAANVLEHDILDISDMYIAESDTKHWMTAFNLTHAEAINEITKWRSDYTRESLSQSAWDTMKESDAASGFTKESYEFSLTRGRTIKQSHATGADDTGMYLLRTEESLPTIATIQELLNADKIEVVSGIDDEGKSVQFAYLTAQMKRLLINNLALSGNTYFRPSFIRVSVAKKDISDDSRYPTLGIDSTLPQYRAPSASSCFQPLQNEYPVRYFFYRTLADRAVLARVIGVSDADSIRYEPAVLSRALLTSWAGKYRGVVDGGPDDKVQGVVYWVKSREEEEALRIYETAKYEVVRCGVHVGEEMDACMGLTFRLI